MAYEQQQHPQTRMMGMGFRKLFLSLFKELRFWREKRHWIDRPARQNISKIQIRKLFEDPILKRDVFGFG